MPLDLGPKNLRAGWTAQPGLTTQPIKTLSATWTVEGRSFLTSGGLGDEILETQFDPSVANGQAALAGASFAEGSLSASLSAVSAHENNGFAVAADGTGHPLRL